MAKGGVKKGFATYLFILLLIIVAAFLVVIVIMLFSPFKNVLGFQYMIYDIDGDPIYRTAADETITYSNIDEININCGYANVVVERSLEVDRDAVKVENRCKGFANSSDNTDFSVDIYFSNGDSSVLNIDVTEPEGFLFFDKEITISILVPAQSSYSLSDTAINITSTSGNIIIGNATALSNNADDTGNLSHIDVNSLNLRTDSGQISLNRYLNETMNDVFIRSNTGRFISYISDMNITNSFELHTSSGFAEISNLTYSNASGRGIVLDLNNGEFQANTLSGYVVLNMDSGYLDVTNLQGSLNANDSVVQMNEATINIDSVEGDISLPFANDSTINVGDMSTNSQIYVRGTDSAVQVQALRGKAFIETTSGDVSIHSYADDLTIKTESGDINIVYESLALNNELNLTSQSGDVNLRVLGDLAFALYAYDANGNDSTNIDVQWQADVFSNPLVVNNGSKYINVTTNGFINVSLIEE